MEAKRLAASFIKDSSNIVAFTGAGVSTESGIPDFRSANGLYNMDAGYDYPPEVMLSRSFFIRHTDLFYDFYRKYLVVKGVIPNQCHLVLGELEKRGKLKGVITQNIDGLHQEGGCRNVLELHGSVYRNYCMKCRKFFGLDYIINSAETVPRCDKCGGIVKPDVVLYEEALDEEVLDRSVGLLTRADVLLVMGTSLTVYPAAGLVNYYRGRKLVLINRSKTSYDGRAAVVLREKAGETLGEILRMIDSGKV